MCPSEGDGMTQHESDVIEKVRSAYDGLTPSQKRIAEGIVDDPEFVAFATVDKLANRLGVSASTIVRFAYRLGLEGYQDLQERVRVLVRSQMRGAADPKEADVTHLDGTVGHSLARDMEQLSRTIANLDPATVAEVVAVLASSRRIFVSGDITTYGVAHFFSLALDRARGETRLVRADGEGAGGIVDIGEGDAVVAFTFPPYSRKVLDVVNWAIERGATTIGVTDRAISPVGQRVEYVLPAMASGLGPQNTLVPALAVANAMLNALILAEPEKSLERYRSVNHILHSWGVYLLDAEDDA